MAAAASDTVSYTHLMGLVLPGTELAEELYRAVQARGEGGKGTQILIKTLAELSGKTWKAHS